MLSSRTAGSCSTSRTTATALISGRSASARLRRVCRAASRVIEKFAGPSPRNTSSPSMATTRIGFSSASRGRIGRAAFLVSDNRHPIHENDNEYPTSEIQGSLQIVTFKNFGILPPLRDRVRKRSAEFGADISRPKVKFRNHLLADLSDSLRDGLLPGFAEVALARGQVLYEAGQPVDYVYFPSTAVLSIVTVMRNGQAVESSTVGRESATPLLCALAARAARTRIFAQIPGSAIRLGAERLREAVQ